MPNTIATGISNVIGLSIAVLYTLAGQAHYTDRFTPGLAHNVEQMTPNSHRAFWFFHLSYPQCKALFGAFDLIAAALLARRSTRRTGLLLAVIGFSGGFYGQWCCDEDTSQVAGLLALAVVGYLSSVVGAH